MRGTRLGRNSWTAELLDEVEAGIVRVPKGHVGALPCGAFC